MFNINDGNQASSVEEQNRNVADDQQDVNSEENPEENKTDQITEPADKAFSIADIKTSIERLINSEYRWPTVLLIVACAVSLISGAFVNLIATITLLFVLLKQKDLPSYAIGVPATIWAIGLLIHGRSNLTIIKILSCCLVLVLWFYLLKAKGQSELETNTKKIIVGMFAINAVLGIPAIFSSNSLPSAHVVFCLCYCLIFWDTMRTKIQQLTSGK